MKIIKKNKKAHFNYYITTSYIVGIHLLGGEVKEIKRGNISIDESYIKFIETQMSFSTFSETQI